MVNQVRKAGDNLNVVATPIVKLVTSCHIGEALFCERIVKVAGTIIENILTKRKDTFIKQCCPTTDVSLRAATACAIAELESLEVAGNVARCRSVRIMHLSYPLTISVTSINEHALLTFACHLKNMCVDADLIPLPFGEFVDVPQHFEKDNVHADQLVLLNTGIARNSFAEQAREHGAASEDVINEYALKTGPCLTLWKSSRRCLHALLVRVRQAGSSGSSSTHFNQRRKTSLWSNCCKS